MACGPATDSWQMGSLKDSDKFSAPQADVKHSEASEAQSCHNSLNKPVKLNIDELFRPRSAKKITQRELFASGRNVMKDIQNKAPVRKTLSALPRSVLPQVGRPSETYKAPHVKAKSVVNKSRPSVGQSHNPSYRRDSQMLQRKTQLPLAPAPGCITNAQKISANSTKKENRHQNGNSSARGIPSRQAKVIGQIPRLVNLENSVNLLNVDDVEEKIVNEASLLKSQLLNQIHKKTRNVNGFDRKKEQNILNDHTEINEKLKLMDGKLINMDEKLDKTLNELTNLKEIIKNLSSNRETECRSCTCHCHTTCSSVLKSNDNTEKNNLEHKVIQPTSDEPLTDTDNCAPGSENKTFSRRRSLRLNNKGAQYAYDSLRKSTKLLTTPRPGSVKKTNTPGRLTRKVIAQLNDLYHD